MPYETILFGIDHGIARHGIYDVAVTRASGGLVAHFRGRCARLRVPSSTPS